LFPGLSFCDESIDGILHDWQFHVTFQEDIQHFLILGEFNNSWLFLNSPDNRFPTISDTLKFWVFQGEVFNNLLITEDRVQMAPWILHFDPFGKQRFSILEPQLPLC
jgi:hypothetical protein